MGLTVFALGNPGRKYEGTLHNAGFEVAKRLAALLGGKPVRRCLRRYMAMRIVAGTASPEGETATQLLVIQPLTYMNKSGDIARFFDLTGSEAFVIFDNLDLPLGTIRIRRVHSLSTHKGLRSLQEALPGVQFTAIYVGIGRPPEGMSVPEYVLSRPDSPASGLFERSLDDAARAVLKKAAGVPVEEIQLEFNRRNSET